MALKGLVLIVGNKEIAGKNENSRPSPFYTIFKKIGCTE